MLEDQVADLLRQLSGSVRGGTAPQQPAIVRFELTANLSAGGSANAQRVGWNGSAYTKSGVDFLVYDFIGSISGVTGNRGYARWWPDRRVFEVFQLYC